MRILKIKLDGESIFIKFERLNKKDIWDEYSMKCAEDATGDFYKALSDLAPFVCEMCEFLADDVKKIKVRGVSFSYAGEKEVLGATIIASKILKMSNTELNLCTPHKTAEFYGDNGDENQLLSAKCLIAIDILITETVKYIEGDRAQIDLFREAKKTESKKEKAIANKE